MKTVLIVPVKYNSKRLKNKNILEIKGLPMFVYSINQIKNSKKINEIYVSTESKKIVNLCKKYKIKYIIRPKYLSLGEVEKQAVIVNALRQLKKKNIVPGTVISYQANSPETKQSDLDIAIEFFNKKLHPNAPIKELISVGRDNIQNAAFRIMTYKAAFQKTLSTKIGIFFTNAVDIHSYKDYIKVKNRLEKI